MVKKAHIEEFLKQKTLAVVGVSRSEKKFPYQLYKALKQKSYKVYAVNPHTDIINGEICYNSLSSIPEQVDAVVVIVPRDTTESIIQEATALGINHIWIQQGAETQQAIDFCRKAGKNVIHNQCVLMYAKPVTFPHNVHRCIWKVIGKFPK